jgi:hypothetical protein
MATAHPANTKLTCMGLIAHPLLLSCHSLHASLADASKVTFSFFIVTLSGRIPPRAVELGHSRDYICCICNTLRLAQQLLFRRALKEPSEAKSKRGAKKQ